MPKIYSTPIALGIPTPSISSIKFTYKIYI